MNILKKNKLYILILMVNLMFTFSIVAQSYLMIDFKFEPLLIIFTISVMTYFLFDFVLKKPVYKTFFVLMVIVIALAYICYFKLAADFYMQGLNNIIDINSAVKSNSITYYEQYKLFFMVFIPLLVFIFLIFANRGSTNLVLIYSMAVMILFWYLGFTKIVKENLSIFIFIGIMSFGVNSSIECLKKLEKSNIKVEINKLVLWLIFLIPALVISIIIAKLPQEYKGNRIGILDGKFINTFAPVKTNSTKSTYGLEDSGYSSSIKKLGGPISLNDNLVFSVKADKAEYLRGSIKDIYNGATWSRNNEDYSLRIKVNSSDNVFSTKTSLSEFLYNEKKLIVYPEQNKKSSIFAPMYTYNVQLDKGIVYHDDIPTFVADLSKVKSYFINYYDTLESQAFENCSNLQWLNEIIDEGNIERLKQEYANYLQVPSSITQRTIDLLDSISSYGESRYNTISKIKEYMDKNYPYTTNVSVVPENEDFIDNFLFVEKKGYCVYFATAATIACRMYGIPARYVEGFKMSDSKDSDGLYKITNKEAHAWCEVLVDPSKDLWTTLEVTPSSISTLATPVTPAKVDIDSKLIKELDNKSEDISKNNAKNQNSINMASYKFSKVNIVIGVFLTIIILVITKIIITLIQIKKVLKGKSIIPYYKYYTKRLKQIGIVKPYNLGDLEYIETLEDEDLKVMFKEVVVAAYGEFYGKKSTRDINRTESYKKLESYIKKSENKVIYFRKKYLFL